MPPLWWQDRAHATDHVCYMHLPKSGGISFNFTLAQAVEARGLSFSWWHYKSVSYDWRLQKPSTAHFLSGHPINFRTPVPDGHRVRYVTMVREPLSWLVSHYLYTRKIHPNRQYPPLPLYFNDMVASCPAIKKHANTTHCSLKGPLSQMYAWHAGGRNIRVEITKETTATLPRSTPDSLVDLRTQVEIRGLRTPARATSPIGLAPQTFFSSTSATQTPCGCSLRSSDYHRTRRCTGTAALVVSLKHNAPTRRPPSTRPAFLIYTWRRSIASRKSRPPPVNSARAGPRTRAASPTTRSLASCGRRNGGSHRTPHLPYLSGLLSLSRHTPEIPFKSACGGGVTTQNCNFLSTTTTSSTSSIGKKLQKSFNSQ